ncbi:Ltp family lipoprotein [Timonella sp. A28]|uniref:Ltp family lipoprotein n=1 Tax=Timonella sp. A28 TaxID=3442640 RepID=UPI003EBC6ABB
MATPALQKKQLLTVLAGIFSIALSGSALSGCEATDAEVPAAQEEHANMPSEEETTKAAEEKPTEEETAKEEKEAVPAEYTAALTTAQNYLEFAHFSEKGLYDQLTSEYGEKFPKKAAQYAVDNVEVNWNEQALKAAKSYRETASMSDAGIHDQLTSEYGEQFTKKQADYAIKNLNK